MPSRAARHVRAPSDAGLLLALLALVCQLALGAVVRPDAASARERATLDAVSVLCIGNGSASVPAPGTVTAPGHDRRAPARRHHAAEIPLAPLDAAQALPAVIPTSCPVLPLPPSVPASRIGERPPGRGPPWPTARVGEPRAPPVPV